MAIMDQLPEFVYETDFHDIPEETVAIGLRWNWKWRWWIRPGD